MKNSSTNRRAAWKVAVAIAGCVATACLLVLARRHGGASWLALAAYGAAVLTALSLLHDEGVKFRRMIPVHGSTIFSLAWHAQERRLPRRLVAPGLGLVLLLGGWLRLQGADWDQGQHLHPDERFLTMVTSALGWPASPAQYLEEANSPLNPRNRGYASFVYGTLPLTAVKGLARLTGQDSYAQICLLGRRTSGLLDTLTIVLVFLLASRLYRDNRIALLAAFLMAVCVLPIQHAHFFVTDPWAAFWIAAALVPLVEAHRTGRAKHFTLAGLLFGLALACKVSVIDFALLIAVVATARGWFEHGRGFPYVCRRALFRLGLSGVAAFVAFRFAQPDSFEGLVSPAQRWLTNMAEARRLMNGSIDFPPGVQWTGRTPLWFPWKNMVLWGMGPLLGLSAWASWLAAAWAWLRGRKAAHLIPVCWVLMHFAWQGSQWVKPLRYQLPIYPALVVLAAWGLVSLRDATHQGASLSPQPHARWRRLGAEALIALVAVGSLLWATAFTSIYRRPHSRVAASRWILQNMPAGTAILNEHWDDALPLRVDGQDPFGGRYHGIDAHWYDDDTPEKLRQALAWLDEADVIVLSSNRLYDSIPRLPMRYPMTIRYYQALFSGKLGFQKVADFTSYPSLCGLTIPDQSAEETFTVYDHPRVQIFRKTAAYSHLKAEAILGNVPWAQIQKLTPRQAERVPNGLWLTPSQLAHNEQVVTWNEMFPPDSLGGRHPLALWIAILFALGLTGVPYLFAITRWLPDRGWGLARIAGWLLPGWSVWLAVSLGWFSFTRAAVAGVSAAWLCGAAALAALQAREIGRFLRGQWRLVLLSEALFWSGFAAMLAIRWMNPDLWHPQLGGEKPMDCAYLNATIRSLTFPPYNPWFSGSFINYYYFGYVLVGAAIKLTGIAPPVAYNLAIPALWAMVVSATFSCALGLTRSDQHSIGKRAIWASLLAIFLVALAGNLGQWRVLWSVWSNGFAVRPEAWFWNATRVIHHAPAEAGPITEFPFFTFLFADLHPHAMALPIALLALGLTLEAAARNVRPRHWGLHLGLALALGALWPANAWDYPIYCAVLLGALCVMGLCKRNTRIGSRPLASATLLFVIIIFGAMCFLPFRQWYGKGYTSLEWWRGSHTPIGDHLLIFGPMLTLIAATLAVEWRFGRARRPMPVGWCLSLLLIAVALALQIAVELVVLRGDISRMNTVFKFYFQSWVLMGLGTAGAAACWFELVPRSHRLLRSVWWIGLSVVVIGGLLYPVLAIPARVGIRVSQATPRGLDGEAWMRSASIRHNGRDFETAGDWEAIGWLRQNATGAPVIAEANTWPVLYSWGNRYSIYTGLPSIIGWDWHERQQRVALPASGVEQRIADLTTLYNTNDPLEAYAVLQRYGVRYVVVGPLEMACYSPEGLKKFDTLGSAFWTKVHENPGVRIYEVIPVDKARSF